MSQQTQGSVILSGYEGQRKKRVGGPMRDIVRMIMVVVGVQLSLASHLWAFAVGEMTVYSHRGAPFGAEVRLLLGPNERDKDIEVTLGDQEVYRAEGLRRAAVIDALKAVMVPEAHDLIRLSSEAPIQESAFDLVLSVRAGQVTIVKHYSVTLPVPTPTMARVVAPLPIIAPMVPITQAPKATTKPTRPPRRTERYGPVEKGETLYSIVRSLHVPNDKIWQAVVALWRANKGQFFAGNLHGLQVGTLLEVPSDLAEHMAAMRIAEAQEIVANQWEEWNTPQHMGTGKQRAIVARGTEARAPTPGKREVAATASGKRAAATPPAKPTAEAPTAPPAAPQEVVLPVGKHGNLVSMTELQTVLQGLEERLMRRLTPTAQAQEVKSPMAFVSTMELQASIQHLEERLTQRMQHLLAQTPPPEPVRVGQRPVQPAPPVTQRPPTVDTAPSGSVLMVPYLLVLTNILGLCLIGGLVWFWVRRRDREERLQRL